MKHDPIHLKIDPKRDVNTYPRKRYNIYILKLDHGGRYCGSKLPETLCGTWRARLLVGYKDRERVTCSHCKRIMLTRFPVPPVNPRSRMAMPRPGSDR